MEPWQTWCLDDSHYFIFIYCISKYCKNTFYYIQEMFTPVKFKVILNKRFTFFFHFVTVFFFIDAMLLNYLWVVFLIQQNWHKLPNFGCFCVDITLLVLSFLINPILTWCRIYNFKYFYWQIFIITLHSLNDTTARLSRKNWTDRAIEEICGKYTWHGSFASEK